MTLSDDQLERYARHIVLKEIGGEGQKKLRTATVAIVGAGGIGIELKVAMDLFQYATASTIILCIFLLVLVVEQASTWLRGRIL